MTKQQSVYDFIRARYEHGATDDEIEQGLDMRHQTASARRRELVLAGRVVERRTLPRRTTRSGRSAQVWMVVGAGREGR